MTQPAEPAALAERIGHTMVITLNRPEARNAVNSAVSTAVGDAMAEAQADPQVRVVILTGAGDKSFCAGADLKAISRNEILTHPDHPEWGFAGYARHAIDKPTIAAVNATALGGGTELVLASDLAVASADAMFGLPEVKRGLLAAAGGVFRLLDQIPRKRALELIFTGEPISAAEALDLGLINQVVTPASGDNAVLDAALALAQRITANAPLAVQASKRVAIALDPETSTVPAEEPRWEQTRVENTALRQTNDAKEGPAAFAEKRQPIWTAT